MSKNSPEAQKPTVCWTNNGHKVRNETAIRLLFLLPFTAKVTRFWIFQPPARYIYKYIMYISYFKKIKLHWVKRMSKLRGGYVPLSSLVTLTRKIADLLRMPCWGDKHRTTQRFSVLVNLSRLNWFLQRSGGKHTVYVETHVITKHSGSEGKQMLSEMFVKKVK